MAIASSEIPAADIVLAQALPRLIEYGATKHPWPHGHSIESYLWPEAGLAGHPADQFFTNLTETASAHYQFAQPATRAFKKRETTNPSPFSSAVDQLDVPGFDKSRRSSWVFQTPRSARSGPSINRTYVTLPADGDQAVAALEMVADAMDDLCQEGVDLKICENLFQVDSIVIYDNDSSVATAGVASFIERLTTHPECLAEEGLVTALPVARGITRAPEVPPHVSALYKNLTGENGLAWTSFASAALKTSVQSALADMQRTTVADNLDTVIDMALQGSGYYFKGLLQAAGVDPITYKAQPLPD